jgi:TetR/AcrR family transcriptional repressor of nem operon
MPVFADALATVELQIEDAPARLDAYANLYLAVLREKRMRLCGMLAAEYQTLPPSMQEVVVRFFDDNETWLTQLAPDLRPSADAAPRSSRQRRCRPESPGFA